jgi:hypothetical protein
MPTDTSGLYCSNVAEAHGRDEQHHTLRIPNIHQIAQYDENMVGMRR